MVIAVIEVNDKVLTAYTSCRVRVVGNWSELLDPCISALMLFTTVSQERNDISAGDRTYDKVKLITCNLKCNRKKGGKNFGYPVQNDGRSEIYIWNKIL